MICRRSGVSRSAGGGSAPDSQRNTASSGRSSSSSSSSSASAWKRLDARVDEASHQNVHFAHASAPGAHPDAPPAHVVVQRPSPYVARGLMQARRKGKGAQGSASSEALLSRRARRLAALRLRLRRWRTSLTSRCACAIWRLSRPQRARGGVAQLVRAPACHAGGRGFKSRLSRQNFHSREKPRTSPVRRFLRSFHISALCSD